MGPRSARWVIVLTVALIGLIPGPSATAAAEGTARATVEGFHTALVDAAALRADTENVWQKRVATLAPEVNRSHDLDFMLEVIMGSKWAPLDAAQRNRLIDIHARHIVSGYAARAAAFDGVQFQYQREKRDGRDLTLLTSTWTSGDGERHRLGYILRRSSRGWRVINVLTDGVSELALLYRRYHTSLVEGGVDGLINSLENELEARRRR